MVPTNQRARLHALQECQARSFPELQLQMLLIAVHMCRSTGSIVRVPGQSMGR